MAEILDLQDQQPEEAPGADKASRVSIRICRNSYISVVLCFVK